MAKQVPKKRGEKKAAPAPAQQAGMAVERVAVGDLVPDPRNARLHGEQNLAAVAGSLKRFGQQKPIVVDADGVVIAGNGTLAAARSLGWTHVDAVRTSLAGDEARAFALADNRTAELAEWDLAELQRTTDELSASLADFSLADIGFGDGQLDDLLASLSPAPEGEGGGERGDGGPEELPDGGTPAGDGDYASKYMVIITCADEAQQADLIAEFEGRGLEFTTPNVG